MRLFCGDPGEAKVYAAEGLESARAAGHALYEAAALGNLGAAERDLGEFDAAIAHMKEGLATRRRLNRPGDYADDIAHLLAAYLAAGDIDAVRATNDELAESLATSAPAIFLPQFAYWIAARAFRELGDRTQMKVEENMVNLSPGMAVTVEIKTGARSVLSYLLSPLLRYKQESLRER